MPLEECPRCQNKSLERYETYSTCLECQYAEEFDSIPDPERTGSVPDWAVEEMKNMPGGEEDVHRMRNIDLYLEKEEDSHG